jgi:hypothetical protein
MTCSGLVLSGRSDPRQWQLGAELDLAWKRTLMRRAR